MIAAKTHCQKFIAYFQSFTNTYAPVDVLRQLYSEAMAPEEIVALSIGTRSDCLPPETLELLSDLNQEKPIWIELGLQSIHAKTLSAMNTHTTVAQFDAAVSKLHALGISVIAHVILGCTASGCSSSKKAFTSAPSNKSNSRCERPTRLV